MERFKPGPGVFKIDYALSQPVPWRAAECRRAITVHLGGSFDEIADAENAVMKGQHPERPFVLAAQPSLFDPTRAPQGQHTFWAYCHVPNGSTVDMTARLEAQIERFAPGFRDCVLARHVSTPATLERMNANLLGGDISGGAMTMRPVPPAPDGSDLRNQRAESLPLFFVDASRGRSPRDVRFSRSKGRTPSNAIPLSKLGIVPCITTAPVVPV